MCNSLAYFFESSVWRSVICCSPYSGQETDVISFATLQIQNCSSGSYIPQEKPTVRRCRRQANWSFSFQRLPDSFFCHLDYWLYRASTTSWNWVWWWWHKYYQVGTDIQFVLPVWAAYRIAKPANISWS